MGKSWAESNIWRFHETFGCTEYFYHQKKKSSFEMKEKKDIERSTFENFTSVMDYFSETLS